MTDTAAVRAIDCWTNVFTPDRLRQMYIETDELHELARWWDMEDPLRGYSPSAMVEEMDRVGIDRICVPAFQLFSYTQKRPLWNFSTEDVQVLVEAAPGRVFGLAGINPLRRMEACRSYVAQLPTSGSSAPICTRTALA
jgi:uncharacterized protein